MIRKLVPLAALLLAANVRADVPPPPPETGSGVILEAMHSELQRALARLRLKGYEAPYFIAYSVRDYEQHAISSRFGAVVTHSSGRSRQAYVEVRVGDYQLDNTSNDREMAFDVDNPDG